MLPNCHQHTRLFWTGSRLGQERKEGKTDRRMGPRQTAICRESTPEREEGIGDRWGNGGAAAATHRPLRQARESACVELDETVPGLLAARAFRAIKYSTYVRRARPGRDPPLQVILQYFQNKTPTPHRQPPASPPRTNEIKKKNRLPQYICTHAADSTRGPSTPPAPRHARYCGLVQGGLLSRLRDRCMGCGLPINFRGWRRLSPRREQGRGGDAVGGGLVCGERFLVPRGVMRSRRGRGGVGCGGDAGI